MHINLLIDRYPILEECRQSIIDAYHIMEKYYEHDGKLLIAGNGGSAVDAERRLKSTNYKLNILTTNWKFRT